MTTPRHIIVKTPDGAEIHRVTTDPVGHLYPAAVEAVRDAVAEQCGTKLARILDLDQIATHALAVAEQGTILTPSSVAREILRHVLFADVPEHRARARAKANP